MEKRKELKEKEETNQERGARGRSQKAQRGQVVKMVGLHREGLVGEEQPSQWVGEV